MPGGCTLNSTSERNVARALFLSHISTMAWNAFRESRTCQARKVRRRSGQWPLPGSRRGTCWKMGLPHNRARPRNAPTRQPCKQTPTRSALGVKLALTQSAQDWGKGYMPQSTGNGQVLNLARYAALSSMQRYQSLHHLN